MSRPVELSVLMPVHSGERHMREAIESILEQSFRAFELVIVDDGSTDAPPGILAEYSREDPRVRVSGLPHRVGGARALIVSRPLAAHPRPKEERLKRPAP